MKYSCQECKQFISKFYEWLGGFDFISEHVKYLDKFCDDFKSTLERMITDGITERKSSELTDALHLECVQHIQFAQERCKLFRGRKKFLEEIQEKANKSR